LTFNAASGANRAEPGARLQDVGVGLVARGKFLLIGNEWRI